MPSDNDPYEYADEVTQIERLENFHLRHHGLILWLILLALVVFIYWAQNARIDEVARASGEVIASSRVQVIQSVDGGVLSELLVHEGDRVKAGQVLARLDNTKVGAAVKEIEARLYALKAKNTRLRAEVTGAKKLSFPEVIRQQYAEQAEFERALFKQRRTGLQEELRTLQVALTLAKEEEAMIKKLTKRGDASQSEILRVKRSVNEAESRRINRRNKFLEDAQIELTRVEGELAQNEQILTQRRQQLENSVFFARTSGIVKNIRITTVGGVLRTGEELIQIVPIDDLLLVEAKVSPVDIARVHSGLEATIRFDPFDYTIYGGVKGKVVYVSADTLKEETRQGREIYYRVHISPIHFPVITMTGRKLEILPGMTAQVDIRTGDRTVMEYLLKPIRKTLSESFGER